MRRKKDTVREQVRQKQHEARQRELRAVESAKGAQTAAEYSEAVRRGVRAAHDYRAWTQALPSS